jgi:tetratricopeptide (TPR) repeat protein
MTQPSVFISCVTSEFGQTRSRVADILSRLGFLPVKQEIFGTESGDLRQVLRDKIDRCEGLIQIIGQGYGAEPPTVDAEFGRVSYTQFEYLYARSRGKKTWLIFAGDACTRDNPLHALDLPWDQNNPDPRAYQSERRALQAEYRKQREQDGHLYHPAQGDAELLLKVEQLKNELEHLRRAEAEWRKKVTRAIVALFVLLAVIAVGIWWKGDDFLHLVYRDTKPTQSRIREHLIEKEEQTHKEELLAIEQIPNPEERQRVRAEAVQQHEVRLARIKSLAENFESLDANNPASLVTEELYGILTAKGEAAGLKYMMPLKAGILERVKARPRTDHVENRADLYPLVITALLHASTNDWQQAEAMFDEIAELEPDWGDALYFRFWFFTAWGEDCAHRKEWDAAETAFGKARKTVEHAVELEPESGQPKRDLAYVLSDIGDMYMRQYKDAEAREAYQAALKISKELADTNHVNEAWPREVSFMLNRLGDLSMHEQKYEEAEGLYLESLRIAEKVAANDRTSTGAQYDLSYTLLQLGESYLRQGKFEQAHKYIEDSYQIANKLVLANPRDRFLQAQLAQALGKLGELAEQLNQWNSAERVYTDLLPIHRDLALVNPDDQRAQRDVSVTLNKLSQAKWQLNKGREAQVNAQESVEIMKKLSDAEPKKDDLAIDLSFSYRQLATSASLNIDNATAQSAFQNALVIDRRLAQEQPDNAPRQYAYVFTQGDVCGLLLQEKKFDEALQLQLEVLPLVRKFAAKELTPKEHSTWLVGLSYALNRLVQCEMNRAGGDLEEGRKYGQESLTIMRDLMAGAENPDAHLRDLLFTLRKMSELESKRNDYESAKKYLEEVIQLRKEELGRFPLNPYVENDLAFDYFDLAKMANEHDDSLTENESLRACYQVLRAMHDRGLQLSGLMSEKYVYLDEKFGKAIAPKAESEAKPDEKVDSTLPTPAPAPEKAAPPPY